MFGTQLVGGFSGEFTLTSLAPFRYEHSHLSPARIRVTSETPQRARDSSDDWRRHG